MPPEWDLSATGGRGSGGGSGGGSERSNARDAPVDRAALRALGLFDARAPRYTSYPPANHFGPAVDDGVMAGWLAGLAPDARLSLYVHIPYCRRLCWFCACRTQGTQTDRPLVPYLDQVLGEIDHVDRLLPPGVTVSAIHLGGGTPTLLPPAMLARLLTRLRGLRPLAPGAEIAAEIDPTEIDEARMGALAEAGLTRASFGVQDFDPDVQAAIGREQGAEVTARAVAMARAAGVHSVNVDLLYGLPHQTRARLVRTIEQVIELGPDRLALYGYAHVPWMAKRQVMIPESALPGPEDRLDLFETARRRLTWAGYAAVGIDHFARPSDSLARAAVEGRLRRNFQGYTDDGATALVGFGASAVSRLPQGYAQNASTSSTYASRIESGRLATERGHAMSADDHLRADLIERLMCDFAIDRPAMAARHGLNVATLDAVMAPLVARFGPWVEERDGRLALVRDAALVARLAAGTLDAYAAPAGRHSRAV